MPDPTIPDTLTQAAERAVYVRLVEHDHDAVRTREVADGVMVDYASDGSVIGVEVLDATAVEIDGQKVPAPVPAVDRSALEKVLRDVHDDWVPQAGRNFYGFLADALLARGLVTTPSPVSQEVRQQVREILEMAYDVIDPDVDTRHDGAVADLVAAGLVTGQAQAVTAEQIETAARELHRRDLGDVAAWWHESEHRRDMWRSKARTAAKAFGLPVEEGAS